MEINFCDQLCCFDSQCQAYGSNPVNLSGYHKVCDYHLESLNEPFLKCCYCETVVIINSLLNLETYFVQNDGQMVEDFNSSRLCLDCLGVSDEKTLDCGHSVCEGCYPNTLCKICFVSEKLPNSKCFNLYHKETSHCICINCRVMCNYPISFQCGHFACDTCISSQCSKCHTLANQGNCSKCGEFVYLFKSLYYFKEYYQSNQCIHQLCWNCRQQGGECQHCISQINEDIIPVYGDSDMVVSHYEITNNSEPSISTSFNNPSDLEVIKCPNCSHQSGSQVFLKCSHKGCSLCEAEEKCKQCIEKKQILCVNCKNNPQTYAVFKCGHLACYTCIFTFCNICESGQTLEKCGNCNKSQNLCKRRYYGNSNENCSHLFCFNCVSTLKQCKFCESMKKDNHPIEEEVKKHFKDSSEMSSSSANPKDKSIPSRKCDKCKNLTSELKFVNFNKNFCSNCFELTKIRINPALEGCIKTCNSCKQESICSKCTRHSEYICSNCQTSHECLCINCKQGVSFNILKCGHLYCLQCFESKRDDCILCLSMNSSCNTCLTKYYIKSLLKCSHISCEACNKFKSDKCLDCIISKGETGLNINLKLSKCSLCSNDTLYSLNLACGHSVCTSHKFDWKVLNYKCFNCAASGFSESKCRKCFNILKVCLDNDQILTKCCDQAYSLSL